MFPTLFWIFMTIFRFYLAFIKSSSSKKLKILIEFNVYSGIISLILIYFDLFKEACFISTFLFGLSMSVIYPIVFTFPIEEGLTLLDSQSSNIITAGVISQGILTSLVGYLMQRIHINVLFVSLSVTAILMLVIRHFCLQLIQKQKKDINFGLGIELVDRSEFMS